MSYPPADSPILTADITNRLEFSQLKIPYDQPPAGEIDKLIRKDRRIQFRSFQLFVQNFDNPDTPYMRLLMKWVTGAGKTIGALGIAMEFIKIYKKMHAIDKDNSPFVFIIGFTKSIFRRELLRHPEFGFVTEEDIAEHAELRIQAETGGPEAQQRLAEFESRLKRRLSNPNYGGYFKFIGYKAFFNRLFQGVGKQTTSEEIEAGLADGSITINQPLVDMMANGLIICDEIHNVYNSGDKNNYGIAIQKILDIYDGRPESLRALFLSATPLNNKPHEVVDLLNLLTSAGYTRADFFDGEDLRSDALKRINKIMQGRISYLRVLDPGLFPTRVICGKSVPTIPYLKFIKCPMPAAQLRTYKKFVDETLPAEGQTILDLGVPNPGLDMPASETTPKDVLFKTKEIKFQINGATQSWRDKNGVELIETDTNTYLGGAFLQLKNLVPYSGKYSKFIKEVHALLRKDCGKMMVYHYYVNMSGILCVGQLLKQNGFIGDGVDPTPNTLCAVCGARKAGHTSKHDYHPARFLILYSDLDKKVRDDIIEKFNDSGNINGYKYKMLLGSKVIQESEDLKAVQQMLLLSVPNNIAALLQLFGRAIRQGSHLGLPADRQNVYIRILVSALPKGLGYEERRYKIKLEDYQIIQKIEQVANKAAIDAEANRTLIMGDHSTEASLAKAKPALGDLYFKLPKLPKVVSETTTFIAYHQQNIVEFLVYVIKRLFLEVSSSWTYDELWKAVQDPPFPIQRHGKWDESLFIVALDHLVWDHDPIAYIQKPSFTGQFGDYSQLRIVDRAGQEHRITALGKYYIMLPAKAVTDTQRISLQEAAGIPVMDIDSWYRTDEDTSVVSLDISDYVKTLNMSYSKLKKQFIERYRDFAVYQLGDTLRDYNLRFHKQFIEDIVKYFFLLLTDVNAQLSEYHEFYAKMLYFYDKNNLVLFADQLTGPLHKLFEKYIGSTKATEMRNRFLMTSIGKTDESYRKFPLSRFDAFVAAQKKRKAKKAPTNMLPVGHFLSRNPAGFRIFLNEEWQDATEPIGMDLENAVENDTIIGYFERSTSDVSIKFKLRPPVQRMKQFTDARRQIRGSVCDTHKKDELQAIADKLDIKLTAESIKDICEQIKEELMKRELASRRRYQRLSEADRATTKRVIWFYMHFELQLRR